MSLLLADLGLDGTGYQRLSAKSRDRAEEARVMDILRSEGLIQVCSVNIVSTLACLLRVDSPWRLETGRDDWTVG